MKMCCLKFVFCEADEFISRTWVGGDQFSSLFEAIVPIAPKKISTNDGFK